MAQRPLEKIVGKRPEEFKFGAPDFMLFYLAELYERSLGIHEYSPTIQNIHRQALGNLRLPEKIYFFNKLRAKGKKAIKDENIESGAYYFGASHYFWQNFVVVEGGSP